jgi:hypothetical protein
MVLRQVREPLMTARPKAAVRTRSKIDVVEVPKHRGTYSQEELPAETDLEAAVVDAARNDKPRQYVAHPSHLARSPRASAALALLRSSDGRS